MRRDDIKHILVIGQACEFDYSGVQAVRALKEEGYEVSLINPNPATVMTTPGLADHIFMEPLTPEYIEKIFEQAGPDAILSTMGGQTALNLTMELQKRGILEKYGVKVIGASAEAIERAEDRGKFKEIMTSLGLESAKSGIAHSIDEALKVKKEIGLPLIIRPSFTLGGMGGAIAKTEEEFIPLVENALDISPVREILLEESLIGWREFEMEVMRDRDDNAIIVCSIENIDPMGVHTGDSITVAPIQSLSDDEYQKMRTASIDILRAVGVDCGGSNVQFAISPDHKRMIVIEMNPRVSRSSALASKATGYPIARISAKLAVGYTLSEILNEITGESVSCFEPALDYVAVKVPRFELEKFPLPASALGTQMRSVGEALALGRTLGEALNKAFRSSEQKLEGIVELYRNKYDVELLSRSAHPMRFLALYTLIKEGERDLVGLSEKTGYDVYFLEALKEQAELDDAISRDLDEETYKRAKMAGMSDKRISTLSGIAELPYHMDAVSHYVDTCAGETKAKTPYCYLTYGEEDEGEALGEKAVIILASGPNRIGQGLEFDTCCTLSSQAYRRLGRKTIMVNSNPETVSTDYNTSDRLYVEPLCPESVLEIMRKEKTKDVVVQLGGQTPLNLAADLKKNGVKILGTSPSVIDLAPETESFIRSCPFPVHFLSADTPIPIKIGYGTPRTLGADRLAAAVAAKEMYPGKNLLIIDAGTAITYDFLSQDGIFTGGNITPGKQMRFESLHNQTARLPLVDENGDCPLTGYDTPSAIRGGVMRGIAYEMNGYIRDYKKIYPDLSVLLTGGDAPLFEQELEGKYTAERHLVLKGLNRILYYNESI